KMNLKTIILALLINSKILDVKLEYSLKPLDKLIKNLRKDSEIELIFELQNSEVRNCKNDDWNSIGIPILRFNNLEKIEVGKNFNSVHTIGLVCITRESDLILLENLAMAFEGMRQERIILWLQIKQTLEIFNEIGNLSEEHNFIDMILIEAVTSENATDNLYRLQPFPRPHFTRGLYQENQLNYLGKNATVILSGGIYGAHNNSYSQTLNIPITSEEDRIFVEFAIKYNLSLNLLTNGEHSTKVDINLDKKLKIYYMDSANPFLTIALLVMVPCAKEKTIQDIILFEVNWWALPLFVMYIIVVILERIILRMNRRIYGGNYSQNLSSLVNLRVFAAILGLKFSGSRRWNFSLRHIFLLLSIFGFLFERFFICTLNSYFIKHPRYAAVTNFEQLRKSGLPLIVDKQITSFVMDNIDPNFFGNTVINIFTTSYISRTRYIFSLNDSFAYIINRDLWTILNKYQEKFNRKTFCNYENLQLISSSTKMQILRKNSVLKKPLTKHVQNLFESGITDYWLSIHPFKHISFLNEIIPSDEENYPFPLSLKDLHFLWILLILGYTLAVVVFYIEV
ncbi:hypothetical protein KR067_002790, partial [Drosophila pandora]